MASSLSTAGLNTLVGTYDSTFPYIMARNASGADVLTARVHTTDGTRFTKGVAANGSIVWTITINGSDCAALPAVIHDIQLFLVSTAGVVQGTIVADVDKTLSSAGDKVVQTLTITEA